MRVRDIVIVGVVLVAALTVVSRCYEGRESAWEARVQSVSAVARQHLARAVEAEAEADSLRSQAAEIAASVDARATVTDSIIVRLPPAETPGEALRDTVIVRLSGERDDARSALALEQRASARLKVALGHMEARGDSLQAVLDDRPSRRPWYLPRIGVGPAAGYNQGHGPHFDPITLNVSWEVKF